MAGQDEADRTARLKAAGLPDAEVVEWAHGVPTLSGDFARDRAACSQHWSRAAQLLSRLPPRPQGNAAERAAAEDLHATSRELRLRFLRLHADAVYDALTAKRSAFVRAEQLVLKAAEIVPGLVPTARELAAEVGFLQRDRSGLEIDHGLLLSAVLGSERSGVHLCHAMLLPRAEAMAALPEFEKTGRFAIAGGIVERRGKAAVVTLTNPRFLNAEDETTLDGAEICVDIALLDRATDVVVMRGAVVDHPKYKGRNVFGAGINLTHLYRGRIPYMFYMQRDLGYVNKLYRGLSWADDPPPDEYGGRTTEKLIIAAVETFAIGGHCQILLTCDYVIAERDAFLTLPARKEGIIPGAANMRLPRFTGDRIARQGIQNERGIPCDSPEGMLICDELVDVGGMDEAVTRIVARLTSSGAVSAASNRRAIRIAQEPLDMFRKYFALYAREQAYCHFSPALIANLEMHWNAQNRRI